MTRYIHQTVLLGKVETTQNTDAAPTGTADAIQVFGVSFPPIESTVIDREFVGDGLGGFEQQETSALAKITYSVELSGSGTAGTAPQWGDLLIACGMAEALLSTPSRVEYSLVSTGLKTATHKYYDAGYVHAMLGCMGNAKISIKKGARPTITFDYLGLDGGESVVANPSATLTAWKTPPVIGALTVVDITLGATYSGGVLSGGTVYPSTGIEIDLGNKPEYITLCSQERIDITSRDTTGSIELELTPAQELTLAAAVRACTTQSIAFTLGTVAGNKIILFSEGVQLAKRDKTVLNNVRTISFSLRFPKVSGNVPFRIVQV